MSRIVEIDSASTPTAATTNYSKLIPAHTVPVSDIAVCTFKTLKAAIGNWTAVEPVKQMI
jgi:hypothetical protein